ncbi:MAG: alanine--tRNA ligase [Alphaproteobacteria bacterium]
MKTSNDIRDAFVDFFARHDHEVVPSSPLVPHSDPTLLFVNAGMVQFKNVFTGLETRPYARAVTAQKCVRAGGKHNDLDNVGYTTRHHTFFEMLGNFSFGDYFKDVAIELAWTLITKEFQIPADRLWITVYHTDDEAFDLWRRIAGLPQDRVIRVATSDNFWSMGDTGPCGPCTEIFYDHGPEIPGDPPGGSRECGDRFVEIWNLVFTQYDQTGPDERVPLAHPSVDTGMGLERLAAVLQGVHDNYDTDIFRSLILASAEVTGSPPNGEHAVSHRVVADHLRAVCFLIADGVLPSNEGRGYVLRRIMRRGMRHVHMLGCQEPAMYRLIPTLVAQMGQPYPELIRAQPLITETLKLEETRFKQTLDRGLKLLEEEMAKLAPSAALPGEVAFKLYDTFGFPIDLTEDVLRAEGRGVDKAGFESAMERQRAEARASWVGSGGAATETVWLEMRERVGATEFLGYDTEVAEGEIVAILKDDEQVERIAAGESAAVVTNQTPFYGEAGGQVGDTGVIFTGEGAEFAVDDTKKHVGDVQVHLGRLNAGVLKLHDIVEMRVEGERRRKLRANHSATHLMHEALRRHLGKHVAQKGSLVAPDRLRFDFSHPKAVTGEEIRAIEAAVNERIRRNGEVVTHFMVPDDAIAAGALALFGEKYGEEVRVVNMGGDQGERFSVEFCGGTHVRRTGDIGLFKIVAESAVAAGVRRIEALSGAAAVDHMEEQDRRLREAAAVLKVAPGDVPERVAALAGERKRLERELAEARRELASGARGPAEAPPFKEVGGVKYAARRLDGVPPKELKPMADEIKKQIGSGVVAIVTATDGKASLVVAVTDDLTARLDAVEFVRAGAHALGGKGGGGRPDMAQAGGPDAAAADKALAAIEEALAAKAKAA